ncbi:MAG: hypothetical protein SP1CHLAM54_07060 [Chlamydiia bacterium]|nr:hypothetical protein [Chlamydiia bacterium]MCH9615612.1 hypothetical protein [Chlamydiia bacterium]MCH9628985.1 hypothetical protein [Chlamydiia bacterium]
MSGVGIRVCNFGEITNPMNNECAITMNDFEATTRVVELACKHIFEEEAIREWVTRDASCPICRHAVDLTQARTELNVTAGSQPNRVTHPPEYYGLPADSMMMPAVARLNSVDDDTFEAIVLLVILVVAVFVLSCISDNYSNENARHSWQHRELSHAH